MQIRGIHRSMTKREKRSALKAVQKLERQLGVAQFGWAVRKYLAIAALKRLRTKRVQEMQREIAKLEQRIA